jgi:hypothetical protein
MKAALRKFAAEMRKAGFDYQHPDEVENDIRARFTALTGGRTIRVEDMSPAQLAALRELQDYERRVAVKSFELAEKLIEPVEAKIEQELYAHKHK